MEGASNTLLEEVIFQRLSLTEQDNLVDEIIPRLTSSQLNQDWLDAFRLAATILSKVENKPHELTLASLLIRGIQSGPSDAFAQQISRCLDQNASIRDCFFDQLLQSSLDTTIQLHKENRLAIATDVFLDKYVHSSAIASSQSGSPFPNPGHHVDILRRNSSLLMALSKTSAQILSGFRSIRELFAINLALVGVSEPDLHFPARNLATCLIPLIVGTATSGRLYEMIFDRIEDLLSAPQPSKWSNTAARLWFQWVSSIPREASHAQELLCGEKYWEMLQSLIQNGHSEERKFALATLQTSVSLIHRSVSHSRFFFDLSDPAKCILAYDRFCMLFQTIVLGRYQNQVEECLDDLERLVASDRTHPTWTETLLKCVFHRDVQEPIRKTIGTWYIDVGSRKPQYFLKHKEFLTSALLPWAITGILFTSTTHAMPIRDSMICLHGEQLSSLISNLITTAAMDSKRDIVTSILSFLKVRGENIYPFALPYIIGGIAQALEGSHLETIDVESACSLALMNGNREIPRDLLTLYCITISRSVLDTACFERSASYRALHANYSRLSGLPPQAFVSSEGSESAVPQLRSFEDMERQILESKYKSLAGSGLVQACKSLASIMELNSMDATLISTIRLVLEAIWDETETQEYPKNVVTMLPAILLRPQLIARFLRDDVHFLQNLQKITEQLYHLAESRVYVLYPVCSALRSIVLTVPECVDALGISDLLLRFSKSPPRPRVEFLIEVSLAAKIHGKLNEVSWETYYGHREGVAYAAVFDLLNRLGSSNLSLARKLLDSLLEPWTKQKLPVPIVSKWKMDEQVQMILVLFDSYYTSLESSEVESYLQKFLGILATEPLPRFRFLFEWIIIRIHITHPLFRPGLLDLVKEDNNPKYAASIIKIALKVACLDDAGEDFALQLMPTLVALSGYGKVAIRHEAQWSIPILWQHCVEKGWQQITKSLAVAAINDQIRSLDKFKKPHPNRILEAFNPVLNHDLTNLFTGSYLDIEPISDRILSHADFQTLWAEDAKTPLPQFLPPGHIPLGSSRPPSNIQTPSQLDEATKQIIDTPTNVPLQNKGISLSVPTLTSSSASRPSHPLIICASLIDNPYNLGGLSRCGEIFGASSLLISDLKHMSEMRFTSVAVTSHLHLPITALSPTDTPAYLRDVKAQGYTVVGVEQTDQSLVLGEEGMKLPRKIVLVLGSEKEGIPARCLVECDFCVEIRQEGVTRSLNVQTAASVVLYEYQRQWFWKGNREGREA